MMVYMGPLVTGGHCQRGRRVVPWRRSCNGWRLPSRGTASPLGKRIGSEGCEESSPAAGGAADASVGVGTAVQEATLASRRVRFGVFEANLQTGELTKQGRRLRLQEQPFQLLALLLERPGGLVTREQLRSRLWPQTTVDFDHGVNKAISKLRDALGDSASNPRFVETVARRGYRFLADVTVLPDPAAEPDTGRQETIAAQISHTTLVPASDTPALPAPSVSGGTLLSPSHRSTSTLGHSFSWMLVGVATALLLTIGGWWIAGTLRQPSGVIHGLAVLPLRNLSHDATQDYLSDGMTEELITQLSQLRSLRVISQTSIMDYKDSSKPLTEIARELDVDAVVEGSVLRSGDRLRMTVHLIAVPAGRQIWAHDYSGDLTDPQALQNRVADDVAAQVQMALNPRDRVALANTKPVNPKAYGAYLKGRYFANKRTALGLQKAIAYYTYAVQTDSNYAAGYSGLADAYALAGDWKYSVLPPEQAFAQASAAAARALAIDDSVGEAHASLAFALDLYAWDWKSADVEFRRAIELNPSDATARQWYSWHLIMMGRTGQALAELQKAESLDPLSLIISADIADALCVAGQYDEAVRQSMKTLELDQNFAVGHFELGQALQQQRKYPQAIAEFQKAIELSGPSGAFESNLAYAYATSGRQTDALSIAETLAARHEQDPSVAADIATIYVGLGDNDLAMMWLDRAYATRFKASILRHPIFDPLRADPRFKDFLHRVGLPG
jgi:TolB-like protein/DNA-binding winged helix-turn-helix (wHTH) protein/Flp pilus assembly protein TadD